MFFQYVIGQYCKLAITSPDDLPLKIFFTVSKDANSETFLIYEAFSVMDILKSNINKALFSPKVILSLFIGMYYSCINIL